MRIKRVWLLFGTLLVVAFLSFYFIRQTVTVQKETNGGEVKAGPSILTNIRDASGSPKDSAITQSDTPKTINPIPIVNDREKTNAIREYMESLNKPIEFYASAVDQNNNPVVGVKVRVEIRHIKVIVAAPWGNEDQVISIEKETDSDGHFEISGVTGDSLTIRSVEKEGYKLSPKTEDIYGYGGVPKPYHPDPQNPVIIRMWKLGESANLISHRSLFGFHPDDRTYTLDLLSDRKIEGASLNGDLQIRFQRSLELKAREPYTWTLEISAVNGGLVEITDEFEYIAPENGYKPQIFFQTNSVAPRSMPDLTKDYYFRSRSGKVYGAVHFDIYSDYNGQCAILVDSRLNPNGSRNLQP